jgi:hypothetical protein
LTWIDLLKSLQLRELVEVPRWHRHPLSGARHPCGSAHLDMTVSNQFRVVTTLGAAVHRLGLSGDQLTMVKCSNFGVVTAATGVHRH